MGVRPMAQVVTESSNLRKEIYVFTKEGLGGEAQNRRDYWAPQPGVCPLWKPPAPRRETWPGASRPGYAQTCKMFRQVKNYLIWVSIFWFAKVCFHCKREVVPFLLDLVWLPVGKTSWTAWSCLMLFNLLKTDVLMIFSARQETLVITDSALTGL